MGSVVLSSSCSALEIFKDAVMNIYDPRNIFVGMKQHYFQIIVSPVSLVVDFVL